MSTFTCSLCHETFERVRSEEDVQAEYKELWPWEYAQGMEKDIICHPCFTDVMNWWGRLSDAEKFQMREEERLQ